MGEAKRRKGFKDWFGNGPDPYLPSERCFLNKEVVSLDYNVMMINYHNDVVEALQTGDDSKLQRYNRMFIRDANNKQVFPETDITKLKPWIEKMKPQERKPFLTPMPLPPDVLGKVAIEALDHDTGHA
jgi:hypothetical protein